MYTVSNAFYYFSNKMSLGGEIKGAKMSNFLSDWQTFIKHSYPLYCDHSTVRVLRI